LPLSLGGLGLLLGGGGGGVDGEGGGGVFGIVDGVGQVALASITDPSGHVLVVGDVDGGGVDVDGVNVCVHDGSFGFFVQSTGGAVPEVQLPAAHVVPLPFPPPDVGIDVLLGCIAADVLLGGVTAAPALCNLQTYNLVSCLPIGLRNNPFYRRMKIVYTKVEEQFTWSALCHFFKFFLEFFQKV